VISPLEFMQRLAALVVPQGSAESAEAAMPAECEAKCAHHRPVRLSWARLFKRVLQLGLANCPKDSFRIGNPDSRTTAAGRPRVYANSISMP
jgi:hypothetical protein